MSRLLGVAPHAQHLLVVAPPAASEAAPDTRFVRSLIDAKDTDTLKDLEIEVRRCTLQRVRAPALMPLHPCITCSSHLTNESHRIHAHSRCNSKDCKYMDTFGSPRASVDVRL